jgi:hypothetical protein
LYIGSYSKPFSDVSVNAEFSNWNLEADALWIFFISGSLTMYNITKLKHIAQNPHIANEYLGSRVLVN